MHGEVEQKHSHLSIVRVSAIWPLTFAPHWLGYLFTLPPASTMSEFPKALLALLKTVPLEVSDGSSSSYLVSASFLLSLVAEVPIHLMYDLLPQINGFSVFQ